MLRVRSRQALGVAVAVLLPAVGQGQRVRSSAPAQRMGSEMRAPMIRRESSLPPIRMGSLQQPSAAVIVYDGYSYGGYSYRSGGRPYTSCYYSSFCRGYSSHGPYVVNNTYSYVHVHTTYLGWPWIVVSAAPAYAKIWAPAPTRIWSPTSVSPVAIADPTTAKPLTVGTADSAGVMRIESASDSVVRVTWVGTTRRIQHARLFLADSVQQSLRGALVDQETRSVLLNFADLASRVAYVGLTITFPNGLIETTLMPFTPPRGQKR